VFESARCLLPPRAAGVLQPLKTNGSIGPLALMGGEKLEHRVGVRPGILHAGLGARDNAIDMAATATHIHAFLCLIAVILSFRLILCHKMGARMRGQGAKMRIIPRTSIYSEDPWN